MPQDTHEWWALLRGVALLNILAWAGVAAWLWRERERVPPDAWQQWRWQLLLSAGYVAGCAWRSMLPVYDVPRLVLVDSFWSSVIVGRSVATLAELCFAAQWALLLRALSRTADCSTALVVSRLLLPLIAVAEMFSWYSVLTTSNAGHVVEETLWGLCALLLVLSFAALWPRIDRGQRPILTVAGAAALAYSAYMFGVDVPMYWARWVADDLAGRGALGVIDGAVDASTRWVVSHRWDDWRGEALWMTSYFSVAVWLSIALVAASTLRWRRAQRTPTASRLSRGWTRRTLSASDR